MTIHIFTSETPSAINPDRLVPAWVVLHKGKVVKTVEYTPESDRGFHSVKTWALCLADRTA